MTFVKRSRDQRTLLFDSLRWLSIALKIVPTSFYYVPGTVLRVQHALYFFILTATLMEKSYVPHSVHEETKTQIVSPGPQS